MTSATIIYELGEWLNTLPPDFAFLLALPFVIAIAAFIQDAIGRQRTGSVLRESYRRVRSGSKGHNETVAITNFGPCRHAASAVRRWRWILSNWRNQRCPIPSSRRGTRPLNGKRARPTIWNDGGEAPPKSYGC
jgi:hypothetical protein